MTTVNKRGTKCAACGNTDTRALDSRSTNRGRRRRIECKACRHRWTTIEIPIEQIDSEFKAAKALRAVVSSMVTVLDEARRALQCTSPRREIRLSTVREKTSGQEQD